MKSAPRVLYGLLLLYVLVSGGYFIINLAGLVDGLWITHARVPFEIDFEQLRLVELRPEATEAGFSQGDRIESINGETYRGESQWVQAARHHKNAGTPVRIGVRRADGSKHEATIALRAGDPAESPGRSAVFFLLLFGGPAPLICLLVGYWVAAARPRDPNAWLVLGLLTVPETLVRFDSGAWLGLWLVLPRLWYGLIQSFAASILLWFGLRFPQRSRLDRLLPWLKWVLLVPQILVFVTFWVMVQYARAFSPEWTPWAMQANAWVGAFAAPSAALSLILYSIALLDNYRTASTADARRRLRVLCFGGLVAITAVLVLVLALEPLGLDESFAVVLPLVGMVLILPFSVAYVVVVQRAMDVRLLVRMGAKYALARGTILVLRILISAAIAFLVIRAVRTSEFGAVALARLGLLAVLLFVVSSRARKLSEVIDRKFFREAYNAELVLSELSDEVRRFKDKTPLLETVTKRISDVLHAPIAVLLRGSAVFQLQHAVGLNITTPVMLMERSSTVRHLAETAGPATLYRDNPAPWFLRADDTEREALNAMQVELLLPLAGREKLMGVMALGPKKSEEPYTPSDLRMLQSVATQTGLALEVTELAHSLASEVAQRERIQREIEIAREVQERLFPQEMPSIPGITTAGACRPAQGVGGDYYDVMTLGDSLVGLAIGDVSGKGISAALLMAGLRASLRGMTLYGAGDLAQMMQKVNQLVYEASASNRYATFFFAVYDSTTGVLRFVNAGHNPPLIIRTSNGNAETRKLEAGGPVIGLLPDVGYSEDSIRLEAGDLLLMYTDGISEAMDPNGEEWGEQRMLDAARRVYGQPAANVLAEVFRAADAFISGALQHDDMTLLIVSKHA